MKHYPVGLQDFEKIRTQGYVYVDKTQYVHRLANWGGYFFLSRPRRFGKSLLVSTLDCVFKGKKELFDGLYIANNWNWSQTNPVIKVSFSNISHKEKGLYKSINDTLDATANDNGLILKETVISGKFKELIELLDKKYGKVVVLIDEYDKPIIDYIDNDIQKAIENRDILKTFYSILKDADAHLKLVFITGVSKFSKVSIFSDLNNLQDITIDSNFSGICGVTQSELEQNFSEELGIYDATQIKRWYNGYSWKGIEKIYNPFSILNFFTKNGDFQNYWFMSGTPTFLMNLAKKEQLYDFENIEMSDTQLNAYNLENLQLTTIMFQTGYLTIKGYDTEFDIYKMGYPNEEVKKSYLEFLANAYAETKSESILILATQMQRALREQNFNRVQNIFNSIFKSIPYEIWQRENEHYYHALIHLTFRLLGIYVESQVQTADGRADAIIILERFVFAFEFKLDGSAEEALTQIKQRGYLQPYLYLQKTCIGIGINFSRKDKKVESMLWEVISGNE